MQGAFNSCTNLIDISEINTSNVTNMNYMFYSCTRLNRLPALDCSKVTSIDQFFGNYTITNLLFFGGFINLKRSMTTYGLDKAPNLNEASCINVLNGLYDFTGNNQTPTSSQGKLKVHQNFLDKVGSRISIATNKGWTITA
jgi:surface protein